MRSSRRALLRRKKALSHRKKAVQEKAEKAEAEAEKIAHLKIIVDNCTMDRFRDCIITIPDQTQNIYECWRSFRKKSIVDTKGHITFSNVITREKIYVLCSVLEIRRLPDSCKMIRMCNNSEQKRYQSKSITYSKLMKSISSLHYLGQDYVKNIKNIKNTQKNYYIGQHTYKFIYRVKKDEDDFIYYEGQRNKEACSYLTDDELCMSNLEDIKRIDDIDDSTEIYDFESLKKHKLDKNIYDKPLTSSDTIITSLPAGIYPKRFDFDSALQSPICTPKSRSDTDSVSSMVQSAPVTMERQILPTETEKALRAELAKVVPEGGKEKEREKEKEKEKESNMLTYTELKKRMSETYNVEESMRSTTIDIISVYLKGQKLLYVEAKVYCEQYLYSLMIPAIFITALCSILSLILQDYRVGPLIVSSLTAVNSVILSLITYLKLDAKAEAHKTTAYSFEKLQSQCEFSSGRLLFADKTISPCDLVEKIGDQVKDIKDKNQFVLPQYIRYKFPLLYSTNVFAEVKRIQNAEILLINELKMQMNDNFGIVKLLKAKGLTRSAELDANLKKQKAAFEAIIQYREKYIDIDEDFKAEISQNITEYNNRRCQCFTWLKT